MKTKEKTPLTISVRVDSIRIGDSIVDGTCPGMNIKTVAKIRNDDGRITLYGSNGIMIYTREGYDYLRIPNPEHPINNK
jgi:hypothetical protein